jgi:DNA polymerase delta subunit 1
MYPIDWYVDDSYDSTVIRAWGKDMDGVAKTLAVPTKPTLRVRSKHMSSIIALRSGRCGIEKMVESVKARSLVMSSLLGEESLIEIQFVSWKKAHFFVSSLIKAGVPKHDMFDLFNPIMSTIHRKASFTSGWLRPDLLPIPDAPVAFPPFVVASWDIEAYSSTSKFPSATEDGDVIICIGVSFTTLGPSAKVRKVVFVWRDCRPNDQDIEVVVSKNEAAMITAFCARINSENTDILLAYNSFGFDNSYLFSRAEYLSIRGDFPGMSAAFALLGRRPTETGVDITKMSTEALGTHDWVLLRTPGRLQLDLLVQIRRDHKLDRYSLNEVARHFIGEEKIDLSPKEMFKLWVNNDANDLGRIVEYCCKDCVLTWSLANKLQVIPSLLEMARATFVPLQWLLVRGQTIKVFSQICRKAWSMGYSVPMDVPSSLKRGNATYEGAKVLEAETGFHNDAPIVVLDFASLYPSIMRANNICPSTLMLTAPLRGHGAISVDVGADRHVWFDQTRKGVVPALLEELADFRSAAKASMAEAKRNKDSSLAALYDGRQLAFKVSMNSCYGFFGVERGFLPIVDIARSVTSIGRNMIIHAKTMAERVEGLRVVYGDTDSIFCKLCNTRDIEKAFEIGSDIAKDVTKSLPDPIKLEFEKAYVNMLLFTKKRYAALKYTRPNDDDGIETKGLQVVRRDSCALVRNVMMGVLEDIIRHANIDRALGRVDETIEKLMKGMVDVDDLVITKRLADSYVNEKQPHLIVAKLIQKRTGMAPQVGDRVAYVHVIDGVEDPSFVRLNNLLVDARYYIDKQMRTPIESVMVIVTNDKEYWNHRFHPVVERFQDHYLAKRRRLMSGIGEDHPLYKPKRQMGLGSFFGTLR